MYLVIATYESSKYPPTMIYKKNLNDAIMMYEALIGTCRIYQIDIESDYGIPNLLMERIETA